MFSQFAKGEFSVEVVGGTHCGPNHDSPKTFNYEVDVLWPNRSLDERGFLADNLAFQEFFDSIGSTELSCELLTSWCAQEIFEICGYKPLKIAVKIWAITGSVYICCHRMRPLLGRWAVFPHHLTNRGTMHPIRKKFSPRLY